MIEPTGPLGPSVYWRRRAVAIAAVVVGVALLAWLISGLVGGDGDQPVQNAVGPDGVVPVQSSPPDDRHDAELRASGSSSATSPPPAPATPAGPPPPPQPCPDAVVKVDAQAGAPEYKVGQRPKLAIVVTNVGQVACTRDVGREHRELIVTSADGAQRLWSSNDCYTAKGSDVRLLEPGQRTEFGVAWAGRTSAPSCPSKRNALPAGDYLVVPKLAGLTGAPAALKLT